MTSLSLGPLAFPTGPLLLLLCAAAAVLLAHGLSPRATTSSSAVAAGRERPRTRSTTSTLQEAVLFALAAARLVHVGSNLPAYAGEPWTVLDVRDGGWHVPTAWFAGLAWVAWHALADAARRRALVAGSALGAGLWIAGTAGLAALAPKALPDLTLVDLASGRPVRLHDVAADRPVVLNLWATWCAPCRHEMPVLAEAQRRHPEVVFVFANQGEAAPAVQRYLQAEQLRLAVVLLDPARTLAAAVASSGLPTTVIFDRRGRRVDAHLGALTAPGLAAKLKPVLPAPPGAASGAR